MAYLYLISPIVTPLQVVIVCKVLVETAFFSQTDGHFGSIGVVDGPECQHHLLKLLPMNSRPPCNIKVIKKLIGATIIIKGLCHNNL